MAFARGDHKAHSCSLQRHHSSSVMQNFEVLFLVQVVRALTLGDKKAGEL